VKRMMRGALLAVAGVAMARAADAQVVHGRVVEDRSGRGVASANLVVLDSVGQPAGYAQSNAFGEFSVRLTRSGSFFVRAERIGYRPATSAMSRVEAGDEVYRVLSMRTGNAALEGEGGGLFRSGFFPRVPLGRHPVPTDTRPLPSSGATASAAPGKAATRRAEPRPRASDPAAPDAKPRAAEDPDRPARAPRLPRPATRGGARHPGGA
jgi:hypothetical protein